MGLGNREMTQLGKAFNELSTGGQIFIDDTPARNMLQITASARRLRRRKKIGLIVVDYIQLVDSEESRDSRQEQIAKISRRLKTLARELQVPVIALSQLNRAVENREDRRPAWPTSANRGRSSRTQTSSCSSIDPNITTPTTSRGSPS